MQEIPEQASASGTAAWTASLPATLAINIVSEHSHPVSLYRSFSSPSHRHHPFTRPTRAQGPSKEIYWVGGGEDCDADDESRSSSLAFLEKRMARETGTRGLQQKMSFPTQVINTRSTRHHNITLLLLLLLLISRDGAERVRLALLSCPLLPRRISWKVDSVFLLPATFPLFLFPLPPP